MNIPTSHSPAATSASIDSQDPLDPSSWDTTISFTDHPFGQNGNLTPRRRAIRPAGMISMDGLWLPYSTAECENISTDFTNSMTPTTITPSQFTPVSPLSWYTGCMMTPAAKQQTPTTPAQISSVAANSGVYTPMSYLESLSHLRDSHHHLPHTVSFQQPRHTLWRKKPLEPNFNLASQSSLSNSNKPMEYKCKKPGCHGRFKRREHVTRHMKSHLDDKPHVCWVPGCNRAFSRGDNLSAHCKTHSKRSGRNRYVSTLDESSPDYDPGFRGQLTPDGRPVYAFTLGESIPGLV